MILTIHQEDEKIAGVQQKRPYIDAGFTIFKKVRQQYDFSLELVKRELPRVNRQVSIELVLEPGNYIILPTTTGCTLKNISNIQQEPIVYVNKNNELNEYVQSTIIDIFRKFDMLMTRELTYIEFKGFYECLDKQISQKEFETNILTKFNSTQKGLTQKGFVDFFKQQIQDLGQQVISKWFNMLGYDNDLFSVRSRCFVLSIHSDNELSIIVRDAIQTDLDSRANMLFVAETGKQVPVKPEGVQLIYAINPYLNAYSYICKNDIPEPVTITLDCSASKGAIFSTSNGIITKKIEPGQSEFLLHLLQDPNSQYFEVKNDFQWKKVE